MSSKEPKKKLVGPWRSLHGVIWLIGIYFLWTRNWWWPGILILVGISALYEGFLQQYVPGAYVEEETGNTGAPEPMPIPAPIMPVSSAGMGAPMMEHRIELLPQVCPSCNAPIRGHEVKWTGAQSANCPYCGTNLPMSKG